jgi:hypothetical protein
MSDFRQDRSEKFKQPITERGNPHGGHGRRAEHDIAEQFETQTGHPLGERAAGAAPGERPPTDAPRDTDLQRGQHARKGQAESPRELNLDQPEKKREGHR